MIRRHGAGEVSCHRRKLVTFNDVTKRVTVTIDLRKAIVVEDIFLTHETAFMRFQDVSLARARFAHSRTSLTACAPLLRPPSKCMSTATHNHHQGRRAGLGRGLHLTPVFAPSDPLCQCQLLSWRVKLGHLVDRLFLVPHPRILPSSYPQVLPNHKRGLRISPGLF